MKQIRDQIHNYIPISPLEVQLLKQPEILRLHRILQNSTLFNTYPSDRTSRFSHSLGTMHVAGQLYKSLIFNSGDDFVADLHKTVRNFIRQLGIFNFLKSSREYLINAYLESEGQSEFFLTQGWSMGGEIEENDEEYDEYHLYYTTVNNLIFQAIRLAALVHDIGQPPFSHVVEYALEDLGLETLIGVGNTDVVKELERLTQQYLKVIAQRTIRPDATVEDARKVGIKPGPLHEMVGIVLIDEMFFARGRIKSDNALENDFWRVCLQISIRIISADQMGHFKSSSFLARAQEESSRDLLDWYTLGNIVNGQVDSDRLDYLRRDPINCGVTELGSFDFERIIKFITPIKVTFKDIGVETNRYFYVPGFDRRAISALADFFHDRMRHYRWLVNHHNVVRTDLSLTRLIIKLADIVNKNSDPIVCNYLMTHQFEQLWTWDKLSDNFRYIDDS